MGFGTHLTWGGKNAKHRVRFSPPYTYARHVASPFLRAFRPEQENKKIESGHMLRKNGNVRQLGKRTWESERDLKNKTQNILVLSCFFCVRGTRFEGALFYLVLLILLLPGRYSPGLRCDPGIVLCSAPETRPTLCGNRPLPSLPRPQMRTPGDPPPPPADPPPQGEPRGSARG